MDMDRRLYGAAGGGVAGGDGEAGGNGEAGGTGGDWGIPGQVSAIRQGKFATLRGEGLDPPHEFPPTSPT